jgi:RND family efflux transporter MFP subunit
MRPHSAKPIGEFFIMRSRLLLFAASLALVAAAARAETSFTANLVGITDEKAVFATVESTNVVPARARIGGTVAELSVRQGDTARTGQIIAVIVDDKTMLRISGLDAQIAAVQSQLAQAQNDLSRADALFRQGAGTRVTLDQARTAMEVATATLRTRTAERDVARQQFIEGQVLAPVAGRVLDVPVTKGTVVLGGDPIATIAESNFILRLRVPERHAITLKAGASVRVGGADLGKSGAQFGKIVLVYPKIEEGRVVADAEVPDLGDFFVGERIRVWIGAGDRRAFIVPAAFIVTRFGLDYVTLRSPEGGTIETPVQRGQERPTPAMPDALEILSGLRAGDVLVKP